MFGFIGPFEFGIILLLVLTIFGPGKLPRVGDSLGKAINNFRRAKNEVDSSE